MIQGGFKINVAKPIVLFPGWHSFNPHKYHDMGGTSDGLAVPVFLF